MPMLLETVSHCLAAGGSGGRLIDNDNIEARQQHLVLAKRFSNRSLYPISSRSSPAVLFRNCKTEPGSILVIALVIAPAQHCK